MSYKIIGAWRVLPVVEALQRCIVHHECCDHYKDMEDLVRGPEDVEEAREEPLWQPQHVDDRPQNIQDAS